MTSWKETFIYHMSSEVEKETDTGEKVFCMWWAVKVFWTRGKSDPIFYTCLLHISEWERTYLDLMYSNISWHGEDRESVAIYWMVSRGCQQLLPRALWALLIYKGSWALSMALNLCTWITSAIVVSLGRQVSLWRGCKSISHLTLLWYRKQICIRRNSNIWSGIFRNIITKES